MNILSGHILSIIAFLPLFGALVILCLPKRFALEMRVISLAFSAAVLILAITLTSSFGATGEFQFGELASWIPALNIHYRVGVDGVSLLMVLLTTILVPAAIAASWFEIDDRVKAFHALILVLETGLIGTFIALDTFLFYVFWEAVLIPMYFIIGLWGSGQRVRSSIKFVIFTTLGSLVMLVGILYCSAATGGTFDLVAWYAHAFGAKEQLWLFGAFALAFAIKVPIVPLHTWLPDAHTDAPTAGSILLAGVLLKMGAYGFYRFAMPLFPTAVAAAAPVLVVLGVIAIIYGGLLALAQDDMKRLIAYSSIAHMGFVVLGFFALEPNAAQGAVLQMFNHGITTGALFIMVGMLYERTKTRAIADYGSAARPMPLLATFFIVLALASAGLPGLSTFVGEFMILLGGFQTRTYYALAAVPGVIIAAAYMLWLIQRVFFGPVRGVSERAPADLGVREHLVIVPIIALIAVIGIWPKPWLKLIEPSTSNFLALAKRGIAMKTVDMPTIDEPPIVADEPPAEEEPSLEAPIVVEQPITPEELPPAPLPQPPVHEFAAPREEQVADPMEGIRVIHTQDKNVTLPPLPPGVEDEDY